MPEPKPMSFTTGTDCADCGPRLPLPPSPPMAPTNCDCSDISTGCLSGGRQVSGRCGCSTHGLDETPFCYVVEPTRCPTAEDSSWSPVRGTGVAWVDCEAPLQPPSSPSPLCPEVMCMMYCEHGFATGGDGCPQCVCTAPPPAGAPPQPPPSPLPTSCPEIMCRMACEYGYKTGDNGCQLCVCLDAPSPPPPPSPPSPSPPPPPPPPSPLPPSPSSQPPPPAAVVSLVLVAAGSVDDFDLVKRTRLRTRVAEAAGVAVQKVTLSVEAASVRLRFSVRVEAAVSRVLAASLEAALPSADAATDMLGVAVLTTPQLTLEARSEPLDLPPRPHRDPISTSSSTSPPLEERASHVETGGGDDSSLGLLLAGVGALVLAALLVVVAAVLFRRAKR